MKQIKEIYVGILQGKDGKGNIVPGTIMFAGPNPFISKGIYDKDNPPPGWSWGPFAEKAIKHDGRGVTVIYEGEEKPKLRAVMDAKKKADEKITAEREKTVEPEVSK